MGTLAEGDPRSDGKGQVDDLGVTEGGMLPPPEILVFGYKLRPFTQLLGIFDG
ncbi:MAG: hypothetical protein KGZ61_05340 [Sandarakinorhabdus sp.]|nr:hypothetical protein [Sandarakinorhabdus sp.]